MYQARSQGMLPQRARFGRFPNSTMIRRNGGGSNLDPLDMKPTIDCPSRTIGRSTIDRGVAPLGPEAEGYGREVVWVHLMVLKMHIPEQ